MNDATLIADLVRAGTSPELIARIVAELVSVSERMSSGHSSGHPVEIPADEALERRRKWDREYKKRRRSASAQCPPDVHRTKVDTPPSVLSSLTESQSGNREVSKKEPKTPRAKGTRLTEGMPMPDLFRQFARDEGMHESKSNRLWVEFVDYWIGLPGERGIKLNWFATWRNRVRAVLGSGNGQQSNGHRAFQTPGRAKTGADAILAGVANFAAKRGLIKPSDQPEDGQVQRHLDLTGRKDAD